MPALIPFAVNETLSPLHTVELAVAIVTLGVTAPPTITVKVTALSQPTLLVKCAVCEPAAVKY